MKETLFYRAKRFLRAIRLPLIALAVLGFYAWGFFFRAYSQAQPQTGYAVITSDLFSVLPVGTALFTFTNSAGVLVSQAGVGAVEPISAGTIFVDQQGTSTAIAIANFSIDTIRVTFILRNASGVEVNRKEEVFSPGQHSPRFVSELFGSLPPNFVGSLSFSTGQAGQKVGAITIRQNTNIAGESIFATLPVVDLSAPASTLPVVFPHLGAGLIGNLGLSTQLVLISRSAQRSVGRITFFAQDGSPLRLQISGVTASEFPFQIEPNGVFRAQLTSLSGVAIGYAVVTLDQGTDTPSGSAIFQYRSQDNRLLSEAGVASTPATKSARIFVDTINTQTGVAIANAGNAATTVTFELIDRSGISLEKRSIALPARGQLALFAENIFTSLPAGFVGCIEITCPDAVVPVTLKLTTNTRGHPILTTLPVADLTRPIRSTIVVFPQIGFGGGFSTLLIFISPDKNKPVTGRVVFVQSSGAALVLPFAGRTGNEFQFRVFAGGVLQLRPGNNATARDIILDPSNPTGSEIVVNEGGSIPLNPMVIDSDGVLRDDFTFTFKIDNIDVIFLDSSNTIFGQRRGYSSLIITQGTIVKAATVTVTTLNAGISGFEITSLTQDSAQNLFLSNTRNHTILQTPAIAQPPQIFAGVNQSAGFRDDERLKSLFNSPAFLAFNPPEASVYVADSGNHRIRRIKPQPLPFGAVETAAGTGQTGSSDGAAAQSAFNNPQGLALDNRGFLWIVDSGNHTIRRMNLLTRTVQTIAGRPGTPGLADGTGDQARFNSPVGIAFETESIAQQLSGTVRDFVSMIVADTGNGAIRRVRDNGLVETIGGINFKERPEDGGQINSSEHRALTDLLLLLARSAGSAFYAAPGPGDGSHATSRLSFSSPTGVVVDSFSNIYISEPSAGRVKTLLRTGAVTLSAEPNSFSSPKGMMINQVGRVLVAESGRVGQEMRYAAPTVTGISPGQIGTTGGDRVTVTGRNLAPDTSCVIGNRVISNVTLTGTTQFTFIAPPLPAGTLNCAVLHRGGRADIGMTVVNFKSGK
ncbi:MAG TPA: IPT/TIG domain-containing protein [Acidobacteriota bacterium]|jgi:hypothetical protein